jgi:hypothetical protein
MANGTVVSFARRLLLLDAKKTSVWRNPGRRLDGGVAFTAAIAALLASQLVVSSAVAAPRFRLDAGLTFSRFEQQVKSELGGVRGERLVEEFQLGYAQSLTYRLLGSSDGLSLAAGGFLQVDVGQRTAARFAGFDADGKARLESAIGGRYVELWMGPLVRAEYKAVFLEAGYAVYGARRDDARSDLATASGDRSGTLRTSATVAWAFALGGLIPLARHIDLVLRMQYRIRYYDERSGAALSGGTVHGTQIIRHLSASLGP